MKSNQILTGVEEVIHEYFRFPPDRYRGNKSAWKNVDLRKIQAERENEPSLASQIFRKVRENIKDGEKWSDENWRFEQKSVLSPKNKQAEKVLEKRFIRLAPKCGWANQVPVCSRTGHMETKKMSIDLVYREDNETYEFIELKVPSKTNNAYFAALEILIYGIFYVLRDSVKESSNKINGKKIHLKVLAPAEYYCGSPSKEMNTKAMEKLLNQDLSKFKTDIDSGIVISFSFEELNHEVFKSDDNKKAEKGLRELYENSPEDFKNIIFSRLKHVG